MNIKTQETVNIANKEKQTYMPLFYVNGHKDSGEKSRLFWPG